MTFKNFIINFQILFFNRWYISKIYIVQAVKFSLYQFELLYILYRMRRVFFDASEAAALAHFCLFTASAEAEVFRN